VNASFAYRTNNVGWVERSETQQSIAGVGLRYRYTQPTYSSILGRCVAPLEGKLVPKK